MLAAAAIFVVQGSVATTPALATGPSQAWTNAITAASVTKSDMSEPNYVYPVVGGGGLSFWPDGRGFTALKPSTAAYAPFLAYDYWWGPAPLGPAGNTTERESPFMLTDGYLLDGEIVTPDVTSFSQTLDPLTGTITTTLGITICGTHSDCTSFTSVRTEFVSSTGVLVISVQDSAATTITLSVTTQSGYSEQISSQDGGIAYDATEASEPTNTLVAIPSGSTTGTIASSDTVYVQSPANTSAVFYLAASSELESSSPDQAALGKATTQESAGYSAASSQNQQDWLNFWGNSEVSVPDSTLMSVYIKSEYLLGATMRGSSIPNGCWGPNPSPTGFNGDPCLEYDQIFEFLAMLNANQSAVTSGYANWVENTLPAAQALAPYYIYSGGPPASPGDAKYPWISSWNGDESQEAGDTEPSDYDWEEFPSANAALMDLLQAQYTNDSTRLGNAETIVKDVTQYMLDNAAPDSYYNNELLEQRFGTPGVKGELFDQSALEWGLRTARDLGFAPASWAGDANNVYIPTDPDPGRNNEQVLYGDSRTTGDQEDGWNPYPYFFINTIGGYDATAWPTYINDISATDDYYVFNRGWAAVLAAESGQGDDAYNELKFLYAPTDQSGLPNPDFWDNLYFGECVGDPSCTSAHTPEVGAHGTLMLGTQAMLFDGRDPKTIRLFPATPVAWDNSTVSFTNLLANGDLTVSAAQTATSTTATITNNTGTDAARTVLVRLPANATGATVTGGTYQGIVNSRFVRVAMTIPADSSADLTITPTGISGWQTIDNTSSAVTYSGSWSTATVPGSISGTEHYTGSIGAKATVTFTGTAVRIIADRNVDHGEEAITLDGAVVNYYDSWSFTGEVQQVIAEFDGLSPGQHTLTITVTGIKRAHATNDAVSLDAFEYVPTSYGSGWLDDPNLTYTGSWTTNGGFHVSSSAGATASAQFLGEGVTVYGTQGPDQGIFDVNVDGVDYGEFDAYSFANSYQYSGSPPVPTAPLISISNLNPNITHTITLTVVGSSNPNALGDEVSLDGFLDHG